MKVIGSPGRKLPLENHPRRYIEREPVEVEASAYYLRALAAGDIVEVPATPKKETP